MNKLACTLAVTWFAVAIGCSQPPAASSAQFDAQKARQTLSDALDAWKSGQSRSLATRKPPIRHVDDDLSAGCKLVSYELPDAAQPIEPFANIAVTLKLRDPRGALVDRKATYQIVLDPQLTVLRSDQ